MTKTSKFQLIGSTEPNTTDRKDHLWCLRGRKYLCLLCGAMTSQPPDYPTPNGWMPDKFEQLTNKDREIARSYRSA